MYQPRRFAQLVCNGGGNVGDDIQTLAANQHLPSIDDSIDRDEVHLRAAGAPRTALIMNGWFSGDPNGWPPSPSIHPIFVGFHAIESFRPVLRRHIDYLRRFAPIGCRDQGTAEFLRKEGVDAETTYCLTLTFPTREPIDGGKVFLVDAQEISIPKALAKNAVKVTHRIAPVGHEGSMAYAQKLLDLYRREAKLVVTTRLHAALPCIAMGIPVVYFGSDADERTSIIRDVGSPIYDRLMHRKSAARGAVGKLLNTVDWEPAPLDVSAVKLSLANAVADRIAAYRDSSET